MRDDFQHSSSGINSPATRHFQIAPGADDLAVRPRAIRCDVAGTATIVDDAGTSIVYHLAAGEILPLRAVKVTAATATLIGLY